MDRELMMFYNVENFYPPDDPVSGLYKWDHYKYGLKVRKIKQVFRWIEEDFGQMPSVIGLGEIGAQSVLEDLTAAESPLQDYQFLYEPSPDARSLSVALLYDPSKMVLHRHETLQFLSQDDSALKTRDVLHAEFTFYEQKIHILVVHLPSQRDRDAKRPQRHHILKQLHQIVNKLLSEGGAVMLMGDFNDNPDAAVILDLSSAENLQKPMHNPFLELFSKQKFSSYHGKKGMCFDQILFSSNGLGIRQQLQSASGIIYRPPQLRAKDQKNSQYPFRTYSGSRYMGGYSDHFPVLLELRNSQK